MSTLKPDKIFNRIFRKDFIYLFEKERERMSRGEGQRERERIPSRLHTQYRELHMGFDTMTLSS